MTETIRWEADLEMALSMAKVQEKLVLVNFFNPSHVFIGGGIANFGNHLLVAIKRAALRRSLPLATSDLVISFSRTGADAGVLGAIMLALEYLFVVEDDLQFSFLSRQAVA